MKRVVITGIAAVALVLVTSVVTWNLASRQNSTEVVAAPTTPTTPTTPPTTVAASEPVRDVEVAVDGRPDGDGSAERPVDLRTALLNRSGLVQPGATVWVRGGTYTGTLTSELVGTEAAPITVRPVSGEHVILDGNGASDAPLVIRGEWTHFWEFEITNTDPDRTAERSAGIEIFGPHTKVINVVVHDAGNGIAFWTPAVDSEVYGAVVFNNGWRDGLVDSRGHGHGLYVQNKDGVKQIVDVISFNNYATGMKAYGEQGYVNNVRFEGNTSFVNGLLSQTPEANLLVGTIDFPAHNIALVDNCLYHPAGMNAPNLSLGHTGKNNQDVTVDGNYVAGGSGSLELREWQNATIQNNVFYATPTNVEGVNSHLVKVRPPEQVQLANYAVDNNQYFDETPEVSFGKRPFAFYGIKNTHGGSLLNYDEWRSLTGFDANSTHADTAPSGTHVVVRPNKYEPGRANITVYNWDRRDAVDVDLSGTGLQVGDRYEIRNAQNFFEEAIDGVYDGNPVSIPMTTWTVAQPIGYQFDASHIPQTFPQFGALVVMKQGAYGNVQR